MSKEEVLDLIVLYVQEFLATHEYPPMREEIAKACGITVLTADIALDLLVWQGRLRFNAQQRPMPPIKPTQRSRKRRGIPLDTSI